MFYPTLFPHPVPGLSPGSALKIEAAAVHTLIGGDHAWIARHQDGILDEVLHELRACGLLEWGSPEEAGARGLLEANREPLLLFVRENLRRPRQESDWQFSAPDWAAVERELGPVAREEWQRRLAEWEEEGRANVRQLEGAAGEAAAGEAAAHP